MATKSSKIHVYIFMILIFFLCLLCFSVGTFVGKNVTENEMRKSQGEVAGNLNERTISSIEEGLFDENSELEDSDEVALTNEEINSLAEEFSDTAEEINKETEDSTQTLAVDPNIKQVSTDTVSKADKASESKLEKNPISDVTNRIAQSESATEAYKQPRLPSTVMPLIASSSLGKYTIQIASYTDEKEAQKHASELKQKGYSAFYIPAKIRNKDWFRVSVGLFNDSKKANTFRKNFVLKTKLEAAIVQKITK